MTDVTTQTAPAEPAPFASPAPGPIASAPTALVHTLNQVDFALELEPRNPSDAYKLATVTAKAGMFGVKSAEDALVRIMTGRSLGLPAMTALRSIHVIDSSSGLKAGLAAELKESLTRKHPTVEYLRQTESSDTKCVYVGKRRGEPEQRAEWTIERAVVAGLVDRGADDEKKKKNNWNRYPAQMLRARARSEICSIVCPEAVLGLPTTEELHDDRTITVDPNTGEVLDRGGVPSTSVPTPDYARKADELKLQISAAKTKEERQAVRQAIAAADLPEPWKGEVQAAYNAAISAGKKSEQAQREPGVD